MTILPPYKMVPLSTAPGEPYYGEIRGLDGVVACGTTVEECRNPLEDALDARLVLGLHLGHIVSEIDDIKPDGLKVAG